MNHLDFFRLQAKNLFRDYKTQKLVDGIYTYSPKFFDIDSIFLSYHGLFDIDGWDEGNLTLMKIQHLFATIYGFDKWADLANASEAELRLKKLLFDNQHKISVDEWGDYITGVESDNNMTFDTEAKISIFEHVFANVEEHHNTFGDWRLSTK